MDIQKYIKDEGFSPFASDETVLETMKAQSEDRGLIKGKGVFTETQEQNRPSAFNQMISCNWIDPDFFWGWRVRVENEQAQGIKYSKMVSLLIEGMKAQQREINELKKKIN